MHRHVRHLLLSLTALTAACSANGQSSSPTRNVPDNAGSIAATPVAQAPFAMQRMGEFDQPWALAFIPRSDALLVTELGGALKLWRPGQTAVTIAGTPVPVVAGQGGLGDVALHPDFASNRLVYLSWVARGEGGTGAMVGRGRLSEDMTRIEGFATIWRQVPFVRGNGHFGHRLVFSPGGSLYISSGERQKFDPAQNLDQNLGKIIRLSDDGQPMRSNPGYVRGGVRAEIWSYGHRNPLGIAFDSAGRLWELEMGPAGGDELNLIERVGNYGYPLVSNGDHYDGRVIPDHDPADGFIAPRLWWNPAISPADLMIYSGSAFPAWRGDAFIAALGVTALIRVDLDGETARQGDRWDLGFRVRAVRQGNDGAIWLLEDGDNGGLYRLTPR